MRRILLVLSILLVPMFSHAGLVDYYDLQSFNDSYISFENSRYQQVPLNYPDPDRLDYINTDLKVTGSADFDSIMYLFTTVFKRVGQDLNLEVLDVIYSTQGTIIEGVAYLQGGFNYMLAPVGFTKEMLLSNNFSFINKYFAENPQISSEYQLTVEREMFTNQDVTLPEPASLSLLALALGGVFYTRRKKAVEK